MKNLFWHKTTIDLPKRNKLFNHSSACLWFTGLSGSGKSTLANLVELQLYEKCIHTYILDGDNIRQGLNKDLGFSPEERNENIRRVGEVAKLFVDSGMIILTAFISPYKEDRLKVRSLFNPSQFIEIYVKCDLDICEKRDPKDLYKNARKNKIDNFTGISAPYEIPDKPEIIIDNGADSDPIENAKVVINYLITNNIIQNMK